MNSLEGFPNPIPGLDSQVFFLLAPFAFLRDVDSGEPQSEAKPLFHPHPHSVQINNLFGDARPFPQFYGFW